MRPGTELAGKMQEAKVGFIGIGTMGTPMATNVAKAGYDLRLYDADFEVAKNVGERIGAVAVSDAESLAECDFVIFMLPTSKIVRSVLFTESNQLRIPFREEVILIDMSSSDPLDTIETGRLLAEYGVRLVDAPVSGARERATDGTLSIMVGADEPHLVDAVAPVLGTMCQEIFRTGRLGTGHAMKALNNYVAGASFVASSEALIIGKKFGLSSEVMVDVFNASTGQSFATTHVLPRHVVQGEFSSGFALPLLTKDVAIAVGLREQAGLSSLASESVKRALTEALDEMGDVDHSRAFEYWQSS